MREGLTAEVAINRLDSVYSYKSSTSNITTKMVKDKGGIVPRRDAVLCRKERTWGENFGLVTPAN